MSEQVQSPGVAFARIESLVRATPDPLPEEFLDCAQLLLQGPVSDEELCVFGEGLVMLAYDLPESYARKALLQLKEKLAERRAKLLDSRDAHISSIGLIASHIFRFF